MDYIILGIIQGLTEILPVSSSGHLVLAGYIFHLESQNLETDIVLHLGTLISILVFFSYRWVPLLKGVIKLERETLRYLLYIVVGTVPAVIFALIFKGTIESLFETPLSASISLMFTGGFLLLSSFKKEGSGELNAIKALIIGLFQAVAIVPGISRSGFTVMGGVLLGLSFRESFEFSFLLSIPAIIGGVAFKALDSELSFNPGMLYGFVLSILFSFLSLFIFKRILVERKFYIFGIYCLVVGFLFSFIILSG